MERERNLFKELARMESLYDHLESEVTELDRLLKKVGFTYGIKSVKETAEELVKGDDV